jgi:hypothetical protein
VGLCLISRSTKGFRSWLRLRMCRVVSCEYLGVAFLTHAAAFAILDLNRVLFSFVSYYDTLELLSEEPNAARG